MCFLFQISIIYYRSTQEVGSLREYKELGDTQLRVEIWVLLMRGVNVVCHDAAMCYRVSSIRIVCRP